MRRNYRNNKIACIQIYLVYRDQGFEAAARLADQLFGKSDSGNWALKKKLELYPKGAWKTDWLTNMYRDLNEIFEKYEVVGRL